jgi:hypothetical protein
MAGGAPARPGGAAARGALAAARLRQVGAGAAPAAAARLRGVRRAGREAGHAVPGTQEGATMMQARDEARARIAARMDREARRGAPVAQEAAEAVTGASARAAASLAAERARRPAGADFAARGRRLRGADPDDETFLDRAVRRAEARRAACEAACWHPTPRPGAGRAATTAG